VYRPSEVFERINKPINQLKISEQKGLGLCIETSGLNYWPQNLDLLETTELAQNDRGVVNG